MREVCGDLKNIPKVGQLDRKSVLQLIKILKNLTNIRQLAVKVEKGNCKRLNSRSKRIEIKPVLFRDFGC